jgi:hypothetical protein
MVARMKVAVCATNKHRSQSATAQSGLRAMPTWLREILVSVAVAAITLWTFAIAIAVGVLVSINIGGRSWLVGATIAVGFLLFVVLPLLWWVMRSVRRP